MRHWKSYVRKRNGRKTAGGMGDLFEGHESQSDCRLPSLVLLSFTDYLLAAQMMTLKTSLLF